MKYLFVISCVCSILLYACKKDVEIGASGPIEPNYVLPQGNASQEANDRIQQLYDRYGSYFLYVFTQKDFEWLQSTGKSNSKIDTAVLGDPAYVGDMLSFLDDIWLKFLPEDFKKAQGIPYRVFMADSIRQYRGAGYPPGMEHLYSDYKVIGKSIAFAGMNSALRTMTPAQKLAKKNLLTSVIWNYYLSNNILDIPAEFYTLSNYTTMPATPVNASNPANLDAYRKRGFLPGSYNATTGAPSEWLTGSYFWTNAKTYDASSFMLHITQRTDAQMAPYLSYPLIKQKYDLLVNYYLMKYHINVRAIANATY